MALSQVDVIGAILYCLKVMLSSISDSSADRIDATDAGGAYNDELLVVILKEAEDLLDLIFAREDLGPVIL